MGIGMSGSVGTFTFSTVSDSSGNISHFYGTTKRWEIGDLKTPMVKMDWGNRRVLSLAGTSGTGKTYIVNSMTPWYKSLPAEIMPPEKKLVRSRNSRPFPYVPPTKGQLAQVQLRDMQVEELEQKLLEECPFIIEDADVILSPAYWSIDLMCMGSPTRKMTTDDYGQFWIDQSAFYINDFVMSQPDNSMIVICGVLDCGFKAIGDKYFTTYMAEMPWTEKKFLQIDSYTLIDQTFGRNVVERITNPDERRDIVMGFRTLGTFSPDEIRENQKRDIEHYINQRGYASIPRDDAIPMLQKEVLLFSKNTVLDAWSTRYT